jgi:hypothetical protein
MHPLDCPGWDYADHPQKEQELPQRSAEVLAYLRSHQYDFTQNAVDTRPTHELLFSNLTPKEFRYFAGNYRGSIQRCLQYYNVKIPADPRVGENSISVSQSMIDLGNKTKSLFAALDSANQLPDIQLSKADKIIYLVAAACQIFVEFLRIHPYANGNGHIARFLIFIFLGRHGYWPVKWPLDDRPPDPPYSTLISEYRNGKKDLLEQFMMKCILGTI